MAAALIVDALLRAQTVWLTLCLRRESWSVPLDNEGLTMAQSLGLALLVFVASGLYRAILTLDRRLFKGPVGHHRLRRDTQAHTGLTVLLLVTH